MGVRAAQAASLWLLLQLTNSAFLVGAVGMAELASILLLSPLGGVLADRLERRLILQSSQVLALVVSLLLWIDIGLGLVEPWHVYLAVALSSAAVTFDLPVRQALIPELVPRSALVSALTLSTPMINIASLVGPALAGGIIALNGVGPVFLLDAVAHVVLIGILVWLPIAPRVRAGQPVGLFSSFVEGVQFVRRRPLLWQVMLIDFLTTLFAAYRALLPVIARDVLLAGPVGFGLLTSAISAGSVMGSALVIHLGRAAIAGRLVLLTTVCYAALVGVLGHVTIFAVALVSTVLLGFLDAISQSIRMSLIQLETPDGIRGRVSALMYMMARGGPAIGQTSMGALAGVLGISTALTLGATVPIAIAAGFALLGRTVRSYRAG